MGKPPIPDHPHSVLFTHYSASRFSGSLDIPVRSLGCGTVMTIRWGCS